jgi:hypothetical protein
VKEGRSEPLRRKHRAHFARLKADCALCGEAIDYSLKYPHPMSFVVDHIKPWAKSQDDSLTNKQPAHATCNSTKRARDVSPIIRRSGALN